MKKKFVLGILLAICAGSCAFAACETHTPQNGGNTEPPEEQESFDTGVREDGDRAYAVVYGLGTITSTDVDIPAEIDCGSYGVLPVERISFDAFKDTAITSVTMPSSITYIGSRAFSGCTSLTTVTMANGAESVSMGEYVFENCTALSSVTLSDWVTDFEQGTFKNCTALKSLTIPDKLQSLYSSTFEGAAITEFDTDGCEGFSWENGLLINKNTIGGYIAVYANPEAKEITVAEGVTLLEARFKDNKNIRKVDLNGTEININYQAFVNSSLEELLNYQNVKYADIRAFEGTPWLESKLNGTENLVMGKVFMLFRSGESDFSVPKGIETIGDHAFEGTAVQSITLPESTDEICSYAFNDCKNLKSLYIYSYTPPFISNICLPKDTVVYARNYSYYKNDILWRNIPNEILPIPSDGFTFTLSEDGSYYIVSYRSAAGDAIIPETYNGLPVKEIADKGFYSANITGITIPDSVVYIGENAFERCKNLKSVTIPESVTHIGNSAFESCTNLESVKINYGVTAIGNNLFMECKNLKTVTLPESVTTIGSFAFNNCSSLDDIKIPDSVTKIGDYAFYGCGITKITIPNSVISIGRGTFGYCGSLATVAFGEDSKLESIDANAFSSCTGLKSIAIPSSVTYLGKNVLGGCTELESIAVPSTEVTIEGANKFHLGYMFASSYNYYDLIPASLKTVTIAGGDTIAEKAFYLCGGITSVTVADSVSSIGVEAFLFCTGLKSVVFGENSKLTVINDEAFWKCESLESVTLPESVTYIGERAFNDCASLTSVTIPESVTHIGDGAFSLCESLTSVTIPKNVTHIGRDAFTGCNSLVEVTFEITDGWRVYVSAYEANISSDDLKDKQNASTLLTETYSWYNWERR